ncbi:MULTISPECIES: OadG family transporter subunit [unclassified Thalassotalea]|uniref:OadG family protein n=1 Tax=unclassified Thalassotalea TaxID=2614972 RepID=UPI0010813C67|nr:MULTISPECIES: OadG family transporter subunit [unclassified Thalassotalea]NMP17901.1 oxaloacetate decarboxylase [Thalassotalea sp. Y01]QBY05107.1 oxaloacetate decarboxylase [Thalassotalea sp. HSM 43]
MENLSQVFIEAGMLLLVGMGFVFAFLTVLIYAIKLLAKIGSHFPETAPQSKKVNTSVAKSDQIAPGVVAAISTAIAHYRKNNVQI